MTRNRCRERHALDIAQEGEDAKHAPKDETRRMCLTTKGAFSLADHFLHSRDLNVGIWDNIVLERETGY